MFVTQYQSCAKGKGSQYIYLTSSVSFTSVACRGASLSLRLLLCGLFEPLVVIINGSSE